MGIDDWVSLCAFVVFILRFEAIAGKILSKLGNIDHGLTCIINAIYNKDCGTGGR